MHVAWVNSLLGRSRGWERSWRGTGGGLRGVFFGGLDERGGSVDPEVLHPFGEMAGEDPLSAGEVEEMGFGRFFLLEDFEDAGEDYLLVVVVPFGADDPVVPAEDVSQVVSCPYFSLVKEY